MGAHAILDVPGLTFGPNLQPEELTRLTEGVIALVNGTISGQGRINWDSKGGVTSTGDFSTANLDLAAPFGPVEGMSGTIHFSDLLRLETPPGQVMNVRSINPGILVENGVIRYQLLPNQLVKIERAKHEAEEIVAKAKTHAEALIARRTRMAEDKIAAEERAAVEQLRSAAADAAAKAAARLIAERHDASSDQKLVDQAIKEIAGR